MRNSHCNFQTCNVLAVRGRNLATVRPNDANDVMPHSAKNGAYADTNSISVKSAKWTVFQIASHMSTIFITFLNTFHIFKVSLTYFFSIKIAYSNMQCDTLSNSYKYIYI